MTAPHMVRNPRREQSTRSLAEEFSEIREICTEESYNLKFGKRQDRRNWTPEDSLSGSGPGPGGSTRSRKQC